MRKRLSLLLLLALLLQLCACGSPAQETATVVTEPAATPLSEAAKAAEPAEIEWVLRTEELCPFGYGKNLSGMAAVGNTLLLRSSDNGTPLLGFADYTVQEDGSVSLGELRPLTLNEPEAPDEATVYELAADGESFYVLCGERPDMYFDGAEMLTNDDYAGRMRLLRYSLDGALLGDLPLSFPDMDAPGMLAIVDENSIALVGNNTVYLASMSEGIQASLSLPDDGFTLSAETCDKGAVVSFMSWHNVGCSYYQVDFAVGALVELPLPQPEDPNELLMGNSCQGLHGEYLTEANNRFYALDFDAGTTEELMQWTYSQFNPFQHGLRVAEQSFLIQQRESDSLLSVRMAAQPKRERSTVRVAVFNTSSAADLVREQDNLSDLYHYEITEYRGEELDRLLVTMGTKDAPDLLLFCNDLYNGALSTASSAYADLYPFLDSDETLSREDFLPNLLPSLEVNGELHEMWSQTGVTSLVIRPEDLGDRSTALTPADLDEILAGTDYEAMFETFMDYENLLKFVAEVGMSRYVDRGSATCSLDDPSFAALIEWCSEMGDIVPEGSDYPYLRYEQVLLGLGLIQTTDLSYWDRLSRVFIGFPTGDGKGSYYAQNYMAPVMAIPSSSQNKEGAWAFIRSQLTESAQRKQEGGLPVNYHVVIEQAKATGSPEAVQQLEEILNNIGFAENNADNQLRDIILENGIVYCQGGKSLEETMKLIQSKASIYLAEHYG